MWSRTVRGDADAARLGQRLQPRGDIDAVAVDVVAIGDHVAEVDADAEGDALVLGDVGIAVGHRPLYLDRAAHRIHHAGKFHQHPVTGGLNDASVMFLDLGIDKLSTMRLETFERSFLVYSHQARVTRHISCEDRGKMAR